jgi:hypothetical protein
MYTLTVSYLVLVVMSCNKAMANVTSDTMIEFGFFFYFFFLKLLDVELQDFYLSVFIVRVTYGHLLTHL